MLFRSTLLPDGKPCVRFCRRISTRDVPSLTLVINTDGCKESAQHVKYLEHVQAQITLSAGRRGEIEIYLTSPQGTVLQGGFTLSWLI